jgi:glutamate--cysteine ligase catalytic subunit
MTAATWIRSFVAGHPEYKQDSVVTQSITYDLVMECKAIGEGRKACRDLLGDVVIDPVTPDEAYDVLLSSSRLGSSERSAAIRQYLVRAQMAHRKKSTDYDERTWEASK